MVLAMLAACGQRGAADRGARSTAVEPVVPALDHNSELRYKYFYLDAVSRQARGDYAGAFDLLNHCLEINPNAAEIHYLLSGYYNVMKQGDKALESVKRAAALSPRNHSYLEQLAGAYYNAERYDEAIDAFERLYATSRERDDVLNVLIQLYARQGDYDKVLATIDRLEQLEGSSEEITLSRMRIYALKGDKKAEQAALRSLSAKHPNDMNYRVMMGNWLLQNGKTEDARREYDHVLSVEPDNLPARMSMLDYYSATGQDTLARRLQEEMLLSDKTPAASKMTLMRNVVAKSEEQGGDSTEVMDLFKRVTDCEHKTTDLHEVRAAYMYLKHQPQDSINAVLEEALQIAPDNASIRLRLVQDAWEREDYDRIVRLCRPALEYNPDEMAFYYFLGLAYSQRGDKDDALHAFQLGVSQINESSNKDIVSDFYAIMGDILHDKGRTAEAFAAYDSCLQWKPDNMGCLNNYAYYLSEKGQHLQQAEQMSYRTIKADPNNSTYLDTYAWILFMQERYEEAAIYIDQAIRNDTTHNEVLLEHGGDIAIMNGDADKAISYWQQAIEAGGDAAVINRKIKQRKYIKP